MTFDSSRSTSERTAILQDSEASEKPEASGATDAVVSREEVHELRNRLYAASLAFRAICSFLEQDRPAAARAAAETMLEKLNGDLEGSRDGSSPWPDDEADNAIRILLVEDDDMEARLLADFLSEHNYCVTRAHDGLDALTRLKRELPDVVLLDMNMPRLDGPRAVASIRADQRWKNLLLIGISGADASSPEMRKTRRSVDLWITKPADPQRIAGAVVELLGKVDRTTSAG